MKSFNSYFHHTFHTALILSGFSTALSLPSLASTQFSITESGEQTIELSGVQEHDVYEDVLIPRTCSRQVFLGNVTVCENVRRDICRTRRDGTRVCEPAVRRECHEEARYGTEFYDCSYWSRQKTGTATDYYVNATLHLKTILPEGGLAQEVLYASIDRGSGTLNIGAAKTSGEFLIFLKSDSETQINGMQKSIRAEAEVTLIPAAAIRKAFQAGISGFEMKQGLLSFEMPTHLFSKEVQVELTVKRQRTLWFAKKLFSDNVSSSALEVTEGADKTRYAIDLTKLGMKEALKNEKNYKIQLKVRPSWSALSGCLNEMDLGEYGSAELNLKKQQI